MGVMKVKDGARQVGGWNITPDEFHRLRRKEIIEAITWMMGEVYSSVAPLMEPKRLKF